MICPFCSSPENKVIDSRPTEDGRSIRRRRECLGCLRRFTTYETIEMAALIVAKKDGSREIFDRQKIKNGILRACEKRPVSVEDIDKAVFEIEQALYNSLEQEIPSKYIGELVMDRLRVLDKVAYVRFASVYREFKDVESFMHELKNLLKDR